MSGLSLGRMLAKTFTPAASRQPDTHRKAREEAKTLAKIHGVEIEAFKLRDGGGWNVWPPRFDSRGQPHPGTLTDPWDGDHYCQDWSEVLEMVKHYAKFNDPRPL